MSMRIRKGDMAEVNTTGDEYMMGCGTGAMSAD